MKQDTYEFLNCQKKKKKIYPNKYQLENKWRRQHNLCSKILYNKMKYLGIN